ncbi:MAG TPA: cytochrome c [Actinomycetota bacterium]|nr:cytochrome c [Actinomycetota bacterium]
MIPLAISTGQAILLGVAIGAGVAVLAFGVVVGMRRRPRLFRPPELDVPQAMKPGPSDADLEKPLLEKHILSSVVFTLVMALSLSVIWFQEPETNADDIRHMQAESVERGRLISLPGSEENQLGFNCVRCHGPGLRGGTNVYEGKIVAVPDLTTVCQRLTIDQIVQTIAEGRPGTDMPSWSVRFAGAMHDQQIQDLVNYILSIQRDIPPDQNRCLNPPAATEGS